MRDAGVKRIRFHDLRHTHASALVDLGWPDNLICERPGWANTRMLREVYGRHTMEGRDAEAAAMFAAWAAGNGR
jgi:integrase